MSHLSILLGTRVSTALLVVASLVWAGTSLAQPRDYKVAPDRDASFDIEPGLKASDLVRKTALVKRDLRVRRSAMRELLLGNSFTATQQEDLEKWYLGYEFPTLTLYTPEALGELYEGRKRLLRDELSPSTNTAAHDHLVGLAFNFFKKVAVEDYHPAVRYNAMLIVSELNERELKRSGSTSAPPRALPAALSFMIQQYKNPDQVDAVRLASLLGIARHVQLDAQVEGAPQAEWIPQAEWQEIRGLALDLVRTREAPAGRSDDGHDWMRRRGVEVLSWLAATKLDQEIVDEIVARVSDSDEHRSVRCESALALNTVKFLPESGKPRLGSTPMKLNAREAAAGLVQFVVDGATTDVERVAKYIKSLQEAEEIYSGIGGGGMSGAGMGRGMAGPRAGGKGMGPPPGGSAGPRPGAGSMGPPPGGSAGPRPGGSSAGPAPGGMRGMMGPGARGGMGGYGSEAADIYGFRLEPVYRKLRYEIACAMKGLRGSEEYRRGDGSGGLYRLVTGAAAGNAADKEYLDRAGSALQDLANKLKVPTEELTTTKFTVDKLQLSKLTNLVSEVLVKAKPAKASDPTLVDPLAEPDPADDLPAAPARPAPKAGKATGKGKSAPVDPEPEL